MRTGRGESERVVFHVDMDAFFASIEQLENPGWRGRPVIVGGVHSARGVVSAASYEARPFGVHSAMPMREARRRCPHAVFVESRHAVYAAYSARLVDVIEEFSPVVEQISVDEAFLDMTGSEGLFGPPAAAARRLKRAIAARLGLTASVGAAPNKFLAKIASELGKPDGLTVVESREIQAFLDPLPVERLMGVGKRTAPELHRLGLYRIGQVRTYGREALQAALGGDLGSHLHALSRGEDARDVEGEWREKSISHETTFEKDTADLEFLGSVLLDLCDRVARRARKAGLSGRTVSLVWRDPDFSRHSRSRTLAAPTSASDVLHGTAHPLLLETVAASGSRPRKFRLLGLRLSGFAGEEQLSLFPQAPAAVDRALDAVRDRFGEGWLRRGRLIQ